MKMFSLVPRSLRKTFSQVFHFTCNLPETSLRPYFPVSLNKSQSRRSSGTRHALWTSLPKP